MKNKKNIIFLLIFATLLTLIPSFIFAQTGKITNPLPTADVPTLIGQIIRAVLGVVGSIALLMFLYGGFMWLTSAGNEQKITKGKNIIVWAIIGLAVIFLSYALVGFVINSISQGGNPQEPQGNTYKCKCSLDGTTYWKMDLNENACKTATGNCSWAPYTP
ncbi:MAG: pilin [Patescibacteria group bacterium]